MKLFGKKALLDNINLKNITKVSVSANNDIIPVLTKKHIPYEVVEDIFFNQFDKSLKHQGIVTYINKVAAYDSLDEYLSQTKDTAGLVVIIDSIQDPYNFGAILRTCDAFGVDAVIYKKNNQVQITDLVSKASMGAINNLNLFREVNLNAAIDKLKKTGYWIYASCLANNSVNINEVKFDAKSVLIVGNEDKGISPSLLAAADHLIKIPMFGAVQSLNVSVATGILLNIMRNNKK